MSKKFGKLQKYLNWQIWRKTHDWQIAHSNERPNNHSPKEFCLKLNGEERWSFVCRLRKIFASENLKTAPIEFFAGNKLKIDHLRLFGCTVFVPEKKNEHEKLSKDATKLKLLGTEWWGPGYILLISRKKWVNIAGNDISSNSNQE